MDKEGDKVVTWLFKSNLKIICLGRVRLVSVLLNANLVYTKLWSASLVFSTHDGLMIEILTHMC